MDLTPAIKLFDNNWFRRNEEQLALTNAECALVNAALGPAPQRWQGEPDTERMAATFSTHPAVLERIGTPLLTVAIGMRGCGPAVEFLLQHGATIDIDETSYNVLHEAAWANATDTLRAVFKSGATDATGVSREKPHTGWPDNISLMYWAAWGGYVEVAELLLAHGAGVHHELPIKGNGERGTTSLHEAVAPGPWAADNALQSNQKKLEVARLLIADGANYDIYTACAIDDADRLRILLGVDPAAANAPDAYGMTPLHWAARAGSITCLRLLLEEGGNADALNKAQRTPLQLAAERDQVAVIRLLAQYADLNTQDKKGRTPLHRATYEGQVAAAEALLEAGADPKVLNKSGKNALEIARMDAKHLKLRTV